jgi:uncharacterized protein YjiS (DUF1127 family)
MAFASITQIAVGGTLSKRAHGLLDTLRARMAQRKVYMTTLNELNQLSNRELADLGLHRSEIKYVAHQAAYDK